MYVPLRPRRTFDTCLLIELSHVFVCLSFSHPVYPVHLSTDLNQVRYHVIFVVACPSLDGFIQVDLLVLDDGGKGQSQICCKLGGRSCAMRRIVGHRAEREARPTSQFSRCRATISTGLHEAGDTFAFRLSPLFSIPSHPIPSIHRSPPLKRRAISPHRQPRRDTSSKHSYFDLIDVE